jgi:RNA polymerase sigma-70 factor, ECF subfamily
MGRANGGEQPVPIHAVEPESRDLILRARRGDPEAFAELMARYERVVLGLAWRMLGNLEDAKDVAQEAFMRFYRHLDKLDSERDPGPWLRTLTVHACRDLRDRDSGRAALSLDDPTRSGGADSLPHPSDLHESFAKGQEVARAMKALDALPAKERAALVLRDVEGLETVEVARLLESSETTVRSQISRARLRLRQILSGGTP